MPLLVMKLQRSTSWDAAWPVQCYSSRRSVEDGTDPLCLTALSAAASSPGSAPSLNGTLTGPGRRSHRNTRGVAVHEICLCLFSFSRLGTGAVNARHASSGG